MKKNSNAREAVNLNMRFMNIQPQSPVRAALHGNFIIDFWFFAMFISLGKLGHFSVLDYFGYHYNR